MKYLFSLGTVAALTLVFLTKAVIADEVVVAPSPVVEASVTPEAAPAVPVASPTPVTRRGDVAPDTETTDRHNCGANDPDCRIRIGEVLNNSILLAPIQIQGGVRFGEDTTNAAVHFRMPLLDLNFQQGDLNAITFDAIYLPEAGGFRLRFTLLDTEALFFCKDNAGDWHAPLTTLFLDSCVPSGFLGIGGTLAQLQWDQAKDRFAGRWADLHLVLNMLRNSNGREYLSRHLNLLVGGSAESICHGRCLRGNNDTSLVRANFAISGMVLSRNNRWELNAYAGYRPNVAAWNNFAIETRTQIMYHLMMGQDVAGTIGLSAEYDYWSRPDFSIGNFASSTERHSAYVGLLFGAQFDGVLQRRR